MASPPFNINQAIPEDDDIVSQHPVNARAFRDVVESWLLIDHNVQGRHAQVKIDNKADPGSGTASVTEVWASSTSDAAGALKLRVGTGAVEWLGPPPGAVMDYAGSTAPEGWLFPYGQAISRSTYARLYAAIGTTYGVGDGTTTFNLPDLRGRVTAGKDDMGSVSANRLTDVGTVGVNGDTLGDVGGEETHLLITAELATHNHTLTDPGHLHVEKVWSSGGADLGVNAGQGVSAINSLISTASATTGITLADAGSNTAHNNLQPTIILNKIIKT